VKQAQSIISAVTLIIGIQYSSKFSQNTTRSTCGFYCWNFTPQTIGFRLLSNVSMLFCFCGTFTLVRCHSHSRLARGDSRAWIWKTICEHRNCETHPGRKETGLLNIYLSFAMMRWKNRQQFLRHTAAWNSNRWKENALLASSWQRIGEKLSGDSHRSYFYFCLCL